MSTEGTCHVDPACAALRPTHLLYLHGFRSSPDSFKARRLKAWLDEHRPGLHWWCPQLPPSPRDALALLGPGLRDWPAARSAVIGSSLGGFYAARVAEERDWPAVLLNPAWCPQRDLAPWVGNHPAWHDPARTVQFTAGHLAEFAAVAPLGTRHAARRLALIAQGDELLSWREMQAGHAGGPLHLIAGSDHALSDFDTHLPVLLRFLGLQAGAG